MQLNQWQKYVREGSTPRTNCFFFEKYCIEPFFGTLVKEIFQAEEEERNEKNQQLKMYHGDIEQLSPLSKLKHSNLNLTSNQEDHVLHRKTFYDEANEKLVVISVTREKD